MSHTPTLAAIDEVYKCAAANVIVRTRITHDLFRMFSMGMKRLLHGLGEATEDELWKPVINPLRRYGFALCAAPLPFNETTIQPPAIDRLHSKCDALAMLYPAQAAQLAAVIELLKPLQVSRENPYQRWLTQVAVQNPTIGAVLIRDSRLVAATERELYKQTSTRRLQVVTPAQLTKDRCFDVLFVIGAERWFPPFVFDAPRSNRTEVAHYQWIKDGRQPPRAFISAAPNAAESPAPADDTEDTYDADDLLPVIDWRGIGQKIAASDIQGATESVEARLVLLEGDSAVFLESSDGASILTIDLEADESTQRIARIQVSEVRPGTFLLLRTTGGGDYVVAEADRYFLKDRAAELRARQHEWKALLRQEVQKDGLLGVSLKLIDLGSASAEEINVRNYISPRSIRTRVPEDFRAVMRLVGLGEKSESYWEMMGEIDHAHRLAGHRIRRQLLRRLAELDLTELERVGRLDITLPDVDAGGLTAFRVLDVSPDQQLVSIGRLGHPFEL
jgi:hypothetical protein